MSRDFTTVLSQSCTILYRACVYRQIAYPELIRMKYRSRTELASNILESANGGATKTKKENFE